MNFFKKFSIANILSAGKSTFIAGVLGLAQVIIPAMLNGTFNTELLATGIATIVLGALTDILNEVKKEANS
jgi:intracellular septation protein A